MDTGATSNDARDMLVVSKNVARKAGIDISKLQPNAESVSMNGSREDSYQITVPQLTVGPFTMTDASVIVRSNSGVGALVTGHFMQEHDVHIRGSTMTITE
jgi:predicted aspartyl protease